MFLAATPGSIAPGSLKDLCFHDLQPTRVRLLKRRWETQVQFIRRILLCKLTSFWAFVQSEAGFAHSWLIDTSHTQSYNNLLFPRWGSHIQLLRLSRISRLS
jgi:hypothetical protein